MNNDYSANDQNPTSATPALVASEVLSPCINIKSLKPGTVLMVEGETDVYELIVRYPEHGIVDVSSNVPALRAGCIGQFMYSVCWSHPGMKRNVIQKGWAMVLQFSKGTYQSQPISSVGVSGKSADGKRWHYDVF
jgi:hypothetical protein